MQVAKRMRQEHAQRSPEFGMSAALKQYLDLPLKNITKDPLVAWQETGCVLKTLHKLAKKYLCICASSVPSERLFSKAGNLITEKRNHLSGSKASKIIFLSNAHL